MSDSAPKFRRWLTEFVVIATGVFVGLAAEGWAEAHSEAAEARVMLGLVAADLRADSLAVSEALETLRSRDERHPEFMDAIGSEPPAYLRALQVLPPAGDEMSPKLEFRTGGYTTLLSSGRTASLSPELAAELSTLYEFDLGRVRTTLDVVETSTYTWFDAFYSVWDAMVSVPRSGGDPIEFRNEALRYRAVARLLMARLATLESRIGEVRSQVLAAAAD